MAGTCAVAHAQTWQLVPALSLESTFTNNVNLLPSEQRESDWVNQITPTVKFTEKSAHTKLSGSISLPAILYARTSENNYLAPEANVTGTVEAVEKFFFIDASANVSQQALSPFGPRSSSLANATQNRYTAQVYSISPYIQGTGPGDTHYYLRQQSLWSDAAGAAVETTSNRIFTSIVDGHVTRDPRPFGWTVEYNRSDNKFQDSSVAGGSESTQIARVRALYQADYSVQLSAILGYEDNRFFLTHERGAVYGAGIVWTPTDRTSLNATAEHRFFGTSYHVAFSHRMPLSVWSVEASRDITNYPQQIATLPGGQNVTALLNALYSGRVPDPTQRQMLVDQLIHDRGLPSQLAGPVPIFAGQVTLVESFTGTFGILGARNSVFLTAFRTRNEPVESIEPTLAPLLQQLSNTTQTGLNVVWTHQLEPNLSLVTNAGLSHATENTGEGGSSRLYSLNAILSRQLTVLTTGYAGVRYQNSSADRSVGLDYQEFAVFLGFTHTFH
jgi:uncharacterized protein (PEP-CTERM system associated)